VAGGRKLVGSAQVRIGTALLQHGSILLADDQALARRLAPPPRDAHAVPGPATLTELLGASPPPERVEEAVIRGFEEEVAAGWSSTPSGLDAEPPPDLLQRYASWDWSWRR
jgi:lipoate-protein ligase A